MHCKGGCSALRERLQCTASEKGKTGTEIVSPILDKRKGRRDTPHMGHSSPQEISAEPDKGGWEYRIRQYERFNYHD